MRVGLRVRPSVTVCWVFGLVACGKLHQPPRQTEFPTLSPDDTYNVRIANLRTTLGRGGIVLRVAGEGVTFSTSACADDEKTMFAGCARCDLAGEKTRLHGSVIEAATRSFAVYPAAVLAAANVEQVAMCSEIVHSKSDTNEIERPAGLADVHGKKLLFSVKSFLGEYRSGSEWTVADITHHEMFHHLEFAQMRAEMYDDAEWNLHNPLGFAYLASNKDKSRGEGFVNAYAMTHVVEDKASVFEMLMAHSEELCELAKTDETIKIKTKIIWRRVLRAVGTDGFMRTAAPCVTWVGI
jgi:hypothetical protein